MSSGRRIVEIPIEKKIERILEGRNLTVTTAESCTGGLIAATLVNADGISSVFKEGYITYSDEAKHRILGVKEETLREFGAVSKETAIEMAEGALEVTGADLAVAVTGIAGPGGGTEEKPVGLVFVSCSFRDHRTIVKRCFFRGDRSRIRNCSMQEALQILYCRLLEE